MKSVILCEGKDDLWFIGYYLYKVAGWKICNRPWLNYEIVALNTKQEVIHLKCGTDSVAIWCVGGKDAFERAIYTIYEKFIANYPFDPIDSIVIMGDRDKESIDEALSRMESWFSGDVALSNKSTAIWHDEIEGYNVSIKITPIIIPFSEDGAIETLLMQSVSEQSREGEIVVEAAKSYINSLVEKPETGKNYLSHERLILKAKYASVVAVTNPAHSTALFQDMVMACPWEQSTYVKDHFDVIVKAISS